MKRLLVVALAVVLGVLGTVALESPAMAEGCRAVMCYDPT